MVRACAVLIAACLAGELRAQTGTPPVRPLPVDAARLQAAGIRAIAGKHLTLFTDLPPSAAVDELPRVFDAAVPQWSQYFQIDPAATTDWRMHGFLIHDLARFKAAGVVPPIVPDFKNGFSVGADLWLYEQPSDYYRRHLLLHEGTHGFMNTLIGGCGPPWYMEAVAEYAATHRWTNGQLTLGEITLEESRRLGRVGLVKQAVQEGRRKTLTELVFSGAKGYVDDESYAWCWALALFLDRHPRYQARFRELLREVRNPEFNAEFRRSFADDLPTMNREWLVFVSELEDRVDVARSAVEFREGAPLAAGGAKATIAAGRGWQSSGIRLEAGKNYRVRASGRYQIAASIEGGLAKPWPCEPGGVTIRYYRGRPLGMLLGAVEPDAKSPGASATLAPPDPPLLHPIALGLEAMLRPETSGTLYLRVNDSNAELSDNAGAVVVEVVESPL